MLGTLRVYALDTGQQIFYDNIKSLKVSNSSDFMAPPIITLNGNDKLNVNFDLLEESPIYLKYRILHCNANWQPSQLLESEYIYGFNEFEVDDFAYSSNTYMHFINYNISIPDESTKFLVSGNYLLQVYPEENPDDILLQIRFAVSEQSIHTSGEVSSITDKGSNTLYQQLTLLINLPDVRGIDPFQDIVVIIEQNNRPETEKIINRPFRVSNNNLIYEHLPELIFEAGNEYRRFETVRTDYAGMHVDSVKFSNGIWHAWLQKDFPRLEKEYIFDSTQFGRFKIDEYNSTNPDLSSDYINVNFSLGTDDLIDGEIYVEGEFTNHQLDERYRLKYDPFNDSYNLSLLLKQGSYNYQYIVKKPNESSSSRLIEGNKYETGNEYLIKVFYSKPGSRADRLISSRTIRNR